MTDQGTAAFRSFTKASLLQFLKQRNSNCLGGTRWTPPFITQNIRECSLMSGCITPAWTILLLHVQLTNNRSIVVLEYSFILGWSLINWSKLNSNAMILDLLVRLYWRRYWSHLRSQVHGNQNKSAEDDLKRFVQKQRCSNHEDDKLIQ